MVYMLCVQQYFATTATSASKRSLSLVNSLPRGLLAWGYPTDADIMGYT